MTLVIMAAGMGSRFGGLKQIEPVGPNGEFIIDYSIYDALRAGFTKVVFIIKEENYEIFRKTIGKRIEGKIDVEYVFQDNNNIPDGYSVPVERIKPLGTGHAILCCKDVVTEPFLVINADDFYGYDSFKIASQYINNNQNEYAYALIGYEIGNTLTANGSVKRGVCKMENHKLVSLIESSVEEVNGEIVASPLNGDESFIVTKDSRASMNMFVFYPNIFHFIEEDFIKFLETADLFKEEFYIPNVVFNHINNQDITCEVIDTTAVWKGITYASDLDSFKVYIKDAIERGVYPVDLYR